MKLGVVTVTAGYWEGVRRLVESFYSFCRFEFEFFIIPNLDKERSVGEAWNVGINRALDANCDYIVVANDDSWLADEDAIEIIIRHMSDNNLWVCRTYNSTEKSWQRGYHFFVLRPEALNEIGYFDEEFHPAYFEDDDFHYRTLMANPSKTDRVLVNIPHEEMKTISLMSKEDAAEFNILVDRNAGRYINKWGGPPGKERWKIPFQEYKEEHPSFGLSLEGIVALDVEADTLE